MDIILGKFLQAAPEAGPPKMAEIPPEVQARLGEAKNTAEASIDELKAILKEYYDRSVVIEGESVALPWRVCHYARTWQLQGGIISLSLAARDCALHRMIESRPYEQ